jgi:hypothetical protein
MTEPGADHDLFDALTAINISGPDENGLLWVSFKPDKIDPRAVGRRARCTTVAQCASRRPRKGRLDACKKLTAISCASDRR